MFDMDLWVLPQYHHHQPSTLDLFDPFDELDRALGRNFMWLNRPSELLLGIQQPRVPNKYRINVDCAGYKPSSIKIDKSDDCRKLVVSGEEGGYVKNSDEDYSHRRFRRTFELPADLATDQLVSFVTSNGHLVIEIPFKESAQAAKRAVNDNNDFLLPRIVDEGETGKKSVLMNMAIPEGLDPSKIKVTCKDRDVIVQAEDTKEPTNGEDKSYSQTYYYRRCTLPHNADFNELKCKYDNGRLSVKAPLNPESAQNNGKVIPIEIPNKK
jgi:HSP20 family molecular chaperone IbpA